MPIIINDQLYHPFHFQLESDFEKTVEELSDLIFGTSSIYIGKKKRMKGSEIITIPDGYVIDMTFPADPKLYIIENEIVAHDPFKHIGIQLLKFATCFDEGKVELRNFLMKEISEDRKLLKRLEGSCAKSNYRNIDNYLDSAVYGTFKAIVVIDEAREELHNVIQKINANISVLELTSFKSENNQVLYHYDTLYDEDQDIETTSNITPTDRQDINYENRIKRRERRAECDTIVVPAREDGFKSVFLNQNEWYAVRIGAAMKDRIKYIAAYQISPISAITHLAEVDSILPYQNTGKYIIKFKGTAKEIKPIKSTDSGKKPQGPIYVKYEKLIKATNIDELLET